MTIKIGIPIKQIDIEEAREMFPPSAQYKCFRCGGVFHKGWSDEEALAELGEKFDVPAEDCEMVCDDCYKAMGFDE